MNCWRAAKRIAGLLRTNNQVKIVEIIKPFCLEQRRFIMSIKHENLSLLFIAVQLKRVFLVNYFLENCGADPNSYGCIEGEKLTCLFIATIKNSELLVNMLLKYGADTEIVCCSIQTTALYYACRDGYFQIVRLLIEHGADVNSSNVRGQTCLMESINNVQLCKSLLSVGADVNLVNNSRGTALMQALEARRNSVITLLLSSEDTNVRLKKYHEEDALHIAVKFTAVDIDRIIVKGSYTKDEVVKVYEMQSCLFYIGKHHKEAKELWKKALKISDKPKNTPMFQNPRSLGKLYEVRDFFNLGDDEALLYLESITGLNNMFTLTAFTEAVRNVKNGEKCIILCKFFLEIMHSLEDRNFFVAIQAARFLIWHYFNLDSLLELNALKAFDILLEYIEEIHTRLERMTSQERIPYGFNVESYLYVVIKIFSKLKTCFSENIYLFYNGIKRIIKLDTRGFTQKSLLQMCTVEYADLIEPIFLECRADVNCTDKDGKNILNSLVEDKSASPELVKKIIDSGFDFRLVKYDEYCLPCRLEREGILLEPVKSISLQCLATKTFCKETMNCFSDVPYHLISLINAHLYF